MVFDDSDGSVVVLNRDTVYKGYYFLGLYVFDVTTGSSSFPHSGSHILKAELLGIAGVGDNHTNGVESFVSVVSAELTAVDSCAGYTGNSVSVIVNTKGNDNLTATLLAFAALTVLCEYLVAATAGDNITAESCKAFEPICLAGSSCRGVKSFCSEEGSVEKILDI